MKIVLEFISQNYADSSVFSSLILPIEYKNIRRKNLLEKLKSKTSLGIFRFLGKIIIVRFFEIRVLDGAERYAVPEIYQKMNELYLNKM